MSEQFTIKRAERSQALLRLAFTGASFAGKTTASLLLAKGIINALIKAGRLQASQNPQIGVIDTERKSAALYSHLVPFDTIELAPPYSLERYTGALRALEAARYPVIIIDQISHAWSGPGGLLSTVKGENFNAWKDATPKQDEFIDAILRSPAHIIVTMRSKTEWVLEDKANARGEIKKSPRRIGMAPVQRPGVEYEFTTLLDLQIADKTRTITVQKDRTGVFTDMQFKSVEQWDAAGHAAVDWLLTGAVPVGEHAEPTAEERAESICAAAERLIPRQPNLPDLARTFDSIKRQLREFAQTLGDDALKPLLDRVIGAKDKRKAELGAPAPALGPDVTVITPDDVDTLESMMMLGRIIMVDFLQEFGVARLAMLPYDAYDDAVTWVIRTAGNNGEELARPARVTAPAQPEKVNPAKAVVDRICGGKHDLLSQA